MKHLHYFRGSFLVTALGILAAFGTGLYFEHQESPDQSTLRTILGALELTFVAAVLSVLEVSLSFDNAVVNALVLRKMTPLWQRRFLTWGILIAVFGMRLVFPLAVVAIVGGINPFSALRLAVVEPQVYAETMLKTHHIIAAFGGAFLLMVGLKYFFNAHKDIHWLGHIERPLVRMGKMEAIELMVVLLALYGFSRFIGSLPDRDAAENAHDFLVAGIFGLVTFIAVDGLTALLKAPEAMQHEMERASAGMFLYLEVLDASFSFDGVIGAFALTHNIFIIAIGLGIGAMFVRSLTILFVDRGILAEFRYLEHGAFYAILVLAVLMFADTVVHIPEVVTGLLGAIFIGFSFWSSIRYRRAASPVGPTGARE
jgi:hypothetical protein